MENLILIGMPGAGKSTIGVILAKLLAYDFIDTDCLIQSQQGRTLQKILDREGYLELRRIEETALLAIQVEGHVIATGGSAVYSQAAMQHLKRRGVTVFLDLPIEIIETRINNFESRGIARRPEQSFQELFDERLELYWVYADHTIDCREKSMEQIAAEIQALL